MNKCLGHPLYNLRCVQAIICLMSFFDNGGILFWGESIKVRFSFLNPSTNFVGIKKRCKMKKSISNIVSFTMSSLFILSSTVALGMMGHAKRNEKNSTNSTITDTLTKENSNTFAAKDKKKTSEESTESTIKEAAETDRATDTTKQATTFSRGGINPYSYVENSSNDEESEKSSPEKNTYAKTKQEIELLDWWDSASSVFAIGEIATVEDIYTGKTFKVKRTMGTNHADTEALTLEDTEIIKSIWGGFSWERRPIHIYIKGRVLAASMSAMPHAGIDSQPAYAYVENRSQGYGAGSNLDVVKNNGMDGHFDIHFLNSTRHMDGKPDPQHQAAIKVAAGK